MAGASGSLLGWLSRKLTTPYRGRYPAPMHSTPGASQVVAEFGPEMSFRALTKMPYLDAVFKEAMRVLPSTSGGFRRLTRDIQVGDVTLPTGEGRRREASRE